MGGGEDKGEGGKGGNPKESKEDNKKARARTSSDSKGARSRRGSSTTRRSSLTSTTKGLQEEGESLARTAAVAAAKAAAFKSKPRQGKVTDFMTASPRREEAGELESGPRTAASTPPEAPEAGTSKSSSGTAGATTAATTGEARGAVAPGLPGSGKEARIHLFQGLQDFRAHRSAATPQGRLEQVLAKGMEVSAASGAPAETIEAIGKFLNEVRQGSELEQIASTLATGKEATRTSAKGNTDSSSTVQALLKEARDQQQQQQKQQQDRSQGGDDGDGFQLVGRGGKIKMGEKVQPLRQRLREQTPYKSRSPLDSSYAHGAAPSYNRPKPKLMVTPTEEQREWARRGLCVGCGGQHSVFEPICKARLSVEQAKATLNAIRFSDGKNRRAPSATVTSGALGSARGDPRLQTRAAPIVPPVAGADSRAGTKRPRETGTGVTPEAKKKPWSVVVGQQDPKLTLCVREKDNSPLSLERNSSLKIAVDDRLMEDFIMKGRMPPKIGLWSRNNLITKITMRDAEALNWMRGILGKSYQVQTPEEYKISRGRVFIAFLLDKFNPGITRMDKDRLAKLVELEGAAMGIDSLFELKLAAKVRDGLALHIVMDEKAEERFKAKDFRMDILSAGGVLFTEEKALRARARANRIQRLKPRPATRGMLQAGETGEAPEIDISDLTMTTGTKENPVVVADSPAEKEKETTRDEGAEEPMKETSQEQAMDWNEEVEKEKGEKEKKADEARGEEEALAAGDEEMADLHANSDELMQQYLAMQNKSGEGCASPMQDE